MDLTNYFFDRYDKNKYPYYARMLQRYDINVFKEYPCNYIDDDEIINKWKSYTHPSSFDDDKEIVFEFMLMSFYLLNEGYVIEEHPNLLFKIAPPSYISEGILKETTRSKIGTKPNGAVAWSDRRTYSNSLTFTKKNNEIPYSINVQDIFKIVSSANKEFKDMTLDEKLEQIRNVFSYIGKTENGKFININIDEISKGYVTKDQLISYQNELQCFRHGEKEMVNKRSEYTEEQKQFLIDYGLMLINATERYLKEKDNEVISQSSIEIAGN